MRDTLIISVLFVRNETIKLWMARLPSGPLYWVLRPVIRPIVSKINGVR